MSTKNILIKDEQPHSCVNFGITHNLTFVKAKLQAGEHQVANDCKNVATFVDTQYIKQR